jgi:hypothetical protein
MDGESSCHLDYYPPEHYNGVPTPVFNGKNLSKKNASKHITAVSYIDKQTGKLVINGVQLSHAGKYECADLQEKATHVYVQVLGELEMCC